MDKINASWEKDGYLLRPARAEDAEPYYEQNYTPLDPEAARLTGSKPVFTHDEVVGFSTAAWTTPAGMISCFSPPRGGSSARASSTRSTGSCGRPISASGSSGPPPAGRGSAPGWWR